MAKNKWLRHPEINNEQKSYSYYWKDWIIKRENNIWRIFLNNNAKRTKHTLPEAKAYCEALQEEIDEQIKGIQDG